MTCAKKRNALNKQFRKMQKAGKSPGTIVASAVATARHTSCGREAKKTVKATKPKKKKKGRR